MSARTLARLAWLLCAAALTLLALELLLIILGSLTAPPPRGWSSWLGQAFVPLQVVGAPILGGLVASRRPGNPYGWLWLGLALGYALSTFSDSYEAYYLVADPSFLPDRRTVVAVAGLGWVLGTTLLPFLLLLYPDGRLPSRRWRPVAWAVVVAAVLGTILYVAPVGGSAEEKGVDIGKAIYYVSLTVVVLSALSLVFRFRQARGVERQQLKWFAYAAAGVGALLLMGEVRLYDLIGLTLWDMLGAAIFSGLYAAIGIAILRYRLYDIDRIINRTLVYGALTVSLVFVYVGVVVGLQFVFRALSGQESQLAVVASTLAIAALFSPLRRSIQETVDRRFYRNKYNARKTLEEFGARLRDETDLDALGEELVEVVRDTVQPAHASLWLRPVGGREPEAKG